MKLDYYPLRRDLGRAEPDLEHELPLAEAVARAKCGETVLVKVWLRTDGPAALDGLEARLREALAPLGLK